ncbi:MAG: hypothetical protein JXQ69_09095 [Paludibacteraceae bacterium]|nr:hypothetical protein [Paludibacteraceae bacterium]
MIKKWLTYLTVATLSVLFSYAACGYNIAKYCCNICEAKGIEALMDEPCHNLEKNTCCSNHHDEHKAGVNTNDCTEKSCQLIHLKVDESIIASEAEKLSTTQIAHVILYATNVLLANSTIDLVNHTLIPPDNPTYKTGRVVLNSNCILRI